MMSMHARFLLIGGSYDRYWSKVIGEALASLGTVAVISEQDLGDYLPLGRDDLILIDATAVEDMPRLIGAIRARQSDARIVVATASPDWRWARQAFQAGAIDYIKKSLDPDTLLSDVGAVLEKRPPPLL